MESLPVLLQSSRKKVLRSDKFKMKSFAIILLIIAAGVFLTQAQDIPGLPNCDPAVVTWHPHPLVCTQ